MDREIYIRALRLERSDPIESIRLFSRLQKENLFFCWYTFLTFMAGPTYAYYFIIKYYSDHSFPNFIITLLWLGVGLYPGFLIYEWRRRRAGLIHLNLIFDVILLIISPIGLYFATLLNLLCICIVAAICACSLFLTIGPLYYLFSGISFSSWSIGSLPPYLDVPIMSISLIYGFLLVLSDPIRHYEELLPNLFKFKRMFIALQLRKRSIAPFLLSVLALSLINKFGLNLVLGEPAIGFTTSLLGGVLFSLSFGFFERDVVKSHLIYIAIVRCVLHKERINEADMRMVIAEKKFFDMYLSIWTKVVKVQPGYPKTIIPLIEAMKIIISTTIHHNDLYYSDIQDYLRDAEDNINVQDPNYEYYLDTISKIEEILDREIKRNPTADKIKHITLKYNAIAQVIKSRYCYPSGETFNEFERWEYEYYKSGQMIDIEVLDGEVNLDKRYKKGDRINGIWGCAKTDQGFIQILDKLKTGDTVTYNTCRESFGFNSIVFERVKKYQLI